MARSITPTPAMRQHLLSLLRKELPAGPPATRRALFRRGLITHDGSLTQDGWRTAVACERLVDQCKHLKIRYEHLAGLRPGQRPEYEAWRHYTGLGYSGCHCEGGAILLLIRAASLDALTRLNSFNSREDACTRCTEAQMVIHADRFAEIRSAIEIAGSSHVADAFDEIYGYDIVREYYPNIQRDAFLALFEAIGSFRLAMIADVIMTAPYTYRKGWPDLTMTRAGEVLWVEVKTTDKLHASQIVTITRMRRVLPGEIHVVQLQ